MTSEGDLPDLTQPGPAHPGQDRISDRVVDESARFGTDAFYAAVGRAFVAMCAVVPVLALIELLDVVSGRGLEQCCAIVPREPSGVDGIFLAHFIHTSWAHLLQNSVPLILLGTFVLAAGARRFLIATAIILVATGVAVWLISDSPVVGASGVLFGWLGYLLMRGIVERSLWNIGVGLLVALLYGWQISGVLPGDEQISWQGHLFGFISGVIAAILVRRRRVRPDEVATAGRQPDDEAPTTPLI